VTRRVAGAAPTRQGLLVRVLRSPWTWAVVLIAVSVSWGIRLQRETPHIFLGSAPLVGRDPKDGWTWRFSWSLIAALGVGAAAGLATWRGWWWRMRTRTIVPTVAIGAAVFAVLLALTDGRDGLLHGAVDPTEYLANVANLPPIGDFVRTFVADIDRYSVHVRGHPPGFIIVLAALDALGLEGGWPVVGLSVIGTALAPAGALVAVWAVAGAEWVRRCAPVLVVAPYALWMMTSADAVYSAVGAWGVATCVLGLRSHGVRAAAWGSASGLLLGGLLFFTYGGATFVLVPLTPAVVAMRRRQPGAIVTVVAAVAAAGVVTAAFAAAGFWWFAGAAETKLQYWAGTAQFRPFAYFALANLAATLIAVGPATFGGLLRLWAQRRRPPAVAVLIVAGLIGLVVSHLSQYSRAEVERIWLLFFPWIALAGGLLVDRPEAGATARRLATASVTAQVALAVVLQAALVSKW
jgi:methylthioxylose transferase